MMQSGYRKLITGCYASPDSDSRFHGGWITAGSVIYVEPKQKPGKLAPAHEMYVRYLDTMGNTHQGWIPKWMKTKDPKRPRLFRAGPDHDNEVSAFDTLRASMDQDGLTPLEWARNFGHLHVRTLIRFCQDLNHRIKPNDTPLRAGLSLFLNKEVAPMAVKTKKAKRTAASEKSAKTKASGEGRTKTLDRSTGNELLEALKNAPGRLKLIPMAQRLANGEVLSKPELTKLRDGVNASAAEARANGKPKTAGLLANANRQVRRLWRRA